jgi:hypothetical protein
MVGPNRNHPQRHCVDDRRRGTYIIAVGVACAGRRYKYIASKLEVRIRGARKQARAAALRDLLVANLVLLRAQIRDAAFQHVSDRHVEVFAEADAWRRTGGEDVAWKQRHMR